MQLWKKNFLTIYLLFLAVIFGGLLILDSYISRNEMEQRMEQARNSERNIYYLAEGMKDEDFSRTYMTLHNAAAKYLYRGMLVGIRINAQAMADEFPEELGDGKDVEVRDWQGTDYLIIREERTVDKDVIRVDYAETLGDFSRQQARRTWIFCGAGLLFAAVIGLLLYYTMRRINRPVNQIAHELRTPLTGIRGYAEYIMMGNLTEEDRFYASKQIVESAENLEDIMEKLLIMGNVREGAIHTKRIRLRKLLDKLKEHYPQAEIDCRIDSVEGDETLLACLLENLTANAAHAGHQVKITVDAEGIRVWNDGAVMDAKTIKALNRGQEPTDVRVGGHGYGIQVCREIARVHGWKLGYRSSEEEGTTAVCQFHLRGR